jgi:hypothetical protein
MLRESGFSYYIFHVAPIFFPKTGADIALSIQQCIQLLEQAALQAEYVPHSIRQRHLRAHDPGQVFEQLLECSKLFVVDRNDGPLEELVAVDVEFHLFCALLRGHLDERGAMGTEPRSKSKFQMALCYVRHLVPGTYLHCDANQCCGFGSAGSGSA